jgi:hypothetical protein
MNGTGVLGGFCMAVSLSRRESMSPVALASTLSLEQQSPLTSKPNGS